MAQKRFEFTSDEKVKCTEFFENSETVKSIDGKMPFYLKTDAENPRYLACATSLTEGNNAINYNRGVQTLAAGELVETDVDLTSYVKKSDAFNISGDATGSGTAGRGVSISLNDTGVGAGTYTKVAVDSKGRVTSGGSLSVQDVTNILGFGTYNGTVSWGNLTSRNGYTPTWGADVSLGGGIHFTQKDGQLFEQIDGTHWQREGLYEVIDTSTVNSYISSYLSNNRYTNSFKTINNNSITGSGNIDIPTSSTLKSGSTSSTLTAGGKAVDFKTINGSTILGSTDIPFKTVNNNSIIGSGNISIPTVTVVDNLESRSTTSALSAYQGLVINNKISNLQPKLDDSTGATMQWLSFKHGSSYSISGIWCQKVEMTVEGSVGNQANTNFTVDMYYQSSFSRGMWYFVAMPSSGGYINTLSWGLETDTYNKGGNLYALRVYPGAKTTYKFNIIGIRLY